MEKFNQIIENLENTIFTGDCETFANETLNNFNVSLQTVQAGLLKPDTTDWRDYLMLSVQSLELAASSYGLAVSYFRQAVTACSLSNQVSLCDGDHPLWKELSSVWRENGGKSTTFRQYKKRWLTELETADKPEPDSKEDKKADSDKTESTSKKTEKVSASEAELNAENLTALLNNLPEDLKTVVFAWCKDNQPK